LEAGPPITWAAPSPDGQWQPDNIEDKMETIILGLMIFSFIIVIAIDSTQKHRRFPTRGK